MRRALPRRVALLVFFYLWPAVLVSPSGPFMSDSVLLAALRLADHGTWTLADEMDPDLASQTLAFDISVFEGRIYSGVGPGASVLAVPFYVLLRPALPWIDDDVIASRRILGYYMANARALGQEPSGHFKGMYLLQICLVLFFVAPLFAGFLVDLDALAIERGAPGAQALAVAIAVGMGSMALYYCSMYSRQAIAFLLLWRAVLLFERRRRPSGRTSVVAGALCGVAVAVDYPAALLAALFVLFTLPRLPLRRSLALVLPLAAIVALTGLYHHMAFGSVLSTPYHHRFWRTPAILAERGIDLAAFQRGPWLGIHGPNPVVMWELCFGYFKGLFLYSPILALGLVGHLAALRRPGDRGRPVFCLLVFFSYLVFNSALGSQAGEHAPQYWGGLSLLWGPRYLFAVLPFLAWGLLSLDWRRAPVRILTVALLVVSCISNVAGAMFGQVIMSAFVFGEELRSPLSFVWGLLLRLGPRTGLLEAYGVSPVAQGGLVVALLGVSAALLWSALGPGAASARPAPRSR